MIMKMRGDKCHPGRGKRVKIPLLPNNEGKKSVNDVGPQQGHDTVLQAWHTLIKVQPAHPYTYLTSKVSQ